MIYAAIAVGAFYVFAGYVVMRAMVMDRVMDQILTALDESSSAQQHLRTRILMVGAWLTLAGGVALAILSPLASVLFVANSLWQGAYLFWAERTLPPEDESDRRGRQQTKNAFVIYLAATAFVIWLGAQGHLRPWDAEIASRIGDLVLIAASAAIAWAVIHMPRKKHEDISAPDINDLIGAGDEDVPAKLRLAPSWNCSPLLNGDTGMPVSVYRLDLSFDLAERIDAWDDTWQATYNESDPANGGFKDEAQRQVYLEEGRAIVAALRLEWPGELDVENWEQMSQRSSQ